MVDANIDIDKDQKLRKEVLDEANDLDDILEVSSRSKIQTRNFGIEDDDEDFSDEDEDYSFYSSQFGSAFQIESLLEKMNTQLSMLKTDTSATNKTIASIQAQFGKVIEKDPTKSLSAIFSQTSSVNLPFTFADFETDYIWFTPTAFKECYNLAEDKLSLEKIQRGNVSVNIVAAASLEDYMKDQTKLLPYQIRDIILASYSSSLGDNLDVIQQTLENSLSFRDYCMITPHATESITKFMSSRGLKTPFNIRKWAAASLVSSQHTTQLNELINGAVSKEIDIAASYITNNLKRVLCCFHEITQQDELYESQYIKVVAQVRSVVKLYSENFYCPAYPNYLLNNKLDSDLVVDFNCHELWAIWDQFVSWCQLHISIGQLYDQTAMKIATYKKQCNEMEDDLNKKTVILNIDYVKTLSEFMCMHPEFLDVYSLGRLSRLINALLPLDNSNNIVYKDRVSKEKYAAHTDYVVAASGLHYLNPSLFSNVVLGKNDAGNDLFNKCLAPVINQYQSIEQMIKENCIKYLDEYENVKVDSTHIERIFRWIKTDETIVSINDPMMYASVKKLVANKFIFSTSPTSKGADIIDAEHKYALVKNISKPVSALNARAFDITSYSDVDPIIDYIGTQVALAVQAESEDLVKINIYLPEEDLFECSDMAWESSVFKLFSDQFGEFADDHPWQMLYRDLFSHAFEVAAKHVADDLKKSLLKESLNFIANKSSQKLTSQCSHKGWSVPDINIKSVEEIGHSFKYPSLKELEAGPWYNASMTEDSKSQSYDISKSEGYQKKIYEIVNRQIANNHPIAVFVLGTNANDPSVCAILDSRGQKLRTETFGGFSRQNSDTDFDSSMVALLKFLSLYSPSALFLVTNNPSIAEFYNNITDAKEQLRNQPDGFVCSPFLTDLRILFLPHNSPMVYALSKQLKQDLLSEDLPLSVYLAVAAGRFVLDPRAVFCHLGSSDDSLLELIQTHTPFSDAVEPHLLLVAAKRALTFITSFSGFDVNSALGAKWKFNMMKYLPGIFPHVVDYLSESIGRKECIPNREVLMKDLYDQDCPIFNSRFIAKIFTKHGIHHCSFVDTLKAQTISELYDNSRHLSPHLLPDAGLPTEGRYSRSKAGRLEKIIAVENLGLESRFMDKIYLFLLDCVKAVVNEVVPIEDSPSDQVEFISFCKKINEQISESHPKHAANLMLNALVRSEAGKMFLTNIIASPETLVNDMKNPENRFKLSDETDLGSFVPLIASSILSFPDIDPREPFNSIEPRELFYSLINRSPYLFKEYVGVQILIVRHVSNGPDSSPGYECRLPDFPAIRGFLKDEDIRSSEINPVKASMIFSKGAVVPAIIKHIDFNNLFVFVSTASESRYPFEHQIATWQNLAQLGLGIQIDNEIKELTRAKEAYERASSSNVERILQDPSVWKRQDINSRFFSNVFSHDRAYSTYTALGLPLDDIVMVYLSRTEPDGLRAIFSLQCLQQEYWSKFGSETTSLYSSLYKNIYENIPAVDCKIILEALEVRSIEDVRSQTSGDSYYIAYNSDYPGDNKFNSFEALLNGLQNIHYLFLQISKHPLFIPVSNNTEKGYSFAKKLLTNAAKESSTNKPLLCMVPSLKHRGAIEILFKMPNSERVFTDIFYIRSNGIYYQEETIIGSYGQNVVGEILKRFQGKIRNLTTPKEMFSKYPVTSLVASSNM